MSERVGIPVQELKPIDPRLVGRYRISARLGAGGMGRVYPGRSPSGHLVAVKVVRPELAEDPGFRRRFAREAAAARKVTGFFTAALVDADADGSPPWLATAYVPGMPLDAAVAAHGSWRVNRESPSCSVGTGLEGAVLDVPPRSLVLDLLGGTGSRHVSALHPAGITPGLPDRGYSLFVGTWSFTRPWPFAAAIALSWCTCAAVLSALRRSPAAPVPRPIRNLHILTTALTAGLFVTFALVDMINGQGFPRLALGGRLFAERTASPPGLPCSVRPIG